MKTNLKLKMDKASSPKHYDQGSKRTVMASISSPSNNVRASTSDPSLDIYSPSSGRKFGSIAQSVKSPTGSKEETRSAFLSRLDNLTAKIFPQEKQRPKANKKDDLLYLKQIPSQSPRESQEPKKFTQIINATGRHSVMQSLTLPSMNIQDPSNARQDTKESGGAADFTDDTHPSKFLRTDSKMQEIIVLRKQNKMLSKRVDELQKEVDSISEFKIAIEYPFDENCFNEKRVALLKAQIAQQRRLIAKLTKSLKLSKTFHKELLVILDLFKGLCTRYKDRVLVKENPEAKREPTFMTDNERLNIQNENQKKKMLDLILAEAETVESFEKFSKNFSDAYNKVLDEEMGNEEMNRLFTIKKKDTQSKFKYKPALKEFIHRYRRLFPLKTIFDVMEPRDKENLDENIGLLMNLAGKIEEKFYQIATFDLMKNNPFYDKSLQVPDFVKKNAKTFEDYVNSKSKFINLNLHGERINELERSLSSLLAELLQFHQLFSLSPSAITLDKVQGLQQSLRKNIESILNLGILLNNESKDILLINTTYNMSKKAEEEKHLLFPQDFDHAMVSPSKQPSAIQATLFSQQRPRNSSFNDEIFSPPSELQYNSYMYNKELECYPIFIKNIAMAMDLISNMMSAYFDNPHMIQTLKKLQYNIELGVLQHERVKAVSAVKELDLDLQRRYIRLLFDNTRKLENFVDIRNKGINNFFEQVIKKIDQAKTTVAGISENGGDLANASLGKTVWHGLNNLKRILKELEGMILNVIKVQQNSNTVDVRGIEEEFKMKFKIIYDQWVYFTQSTTKALANDR